MRFWMVHSMIVYLVLWKFCVGVRIVNGYMCVSTFCTCSHNGEYFHDPESPKNFLGPFCAWNELWITLVICTIHQVCQENSGSLSERNTTPHLLPWQSLYLWVPSLSLVVIGMKFVHPYQCLCPSRCTFVVMSSLLNIWQTELCTQDSYHLVCNLCTNCGYCL